MRIEDKSEFGKLLAASMSIYERQITTSVVDLFFAAMGQYSLEVVREALSRHLQDPEGGRFAPKPADLIRQIVSAKASDGRPGREEAWSIAQRAMDESETVLVSEEILSALSVARPLLEVRDKVAARLAFVEYYDRLVGDKRASGVPFEWLVSLGEDKNRRAQVIQQAKVAGLLPPAKAQALLENHREDGISNDGLAVLALLDGGSKRDPEEMRRKWQELKKGISTAKSDRLLKQQEDIASAERELEQMRLAKLNQSSGTEPGKENGE